MTIIKKDFQAKGTICESCAEVIKRAALKVDGVTEASFKYATEKGVVTFDDSKTDIEKIFKSIESKGYDCSVIDEKRESKNTKEESREGEDSEKDGVESKAESNDTNSEANDEDEPVDDENEIIARKHDRQNQMLAIGMLAIGLLILGYFLLPMAGNLEMPELTSGMGYGLLFIAGLLTGFHCISMCGSFVLTYTAKNAQAGVSSKKSHLMYGAGKTISYTVIGALFGLVGSIIAFTPLMRGVAGVLAGFFLLLYGMKMLNVHPIFRKLTIRTPKFIAKFVHKEEKEHTNPMLIGLLNGLMIACGPLQAMYIMAAGTGSIIQGASLLLVFGLGTLPAMIGFGYFASMISSKMTHKILKFSGIVVMILGIFMLNNGLALTGSGFDFGTLSSGVFAAGLPAVSNVTVTPQGYQEIHMDVTKYGWNPSTFVLKKGVPVKWIINGIELNGCNSGVQVPQLNMKFQIKQGLQTIEFTPTTEGTIPFSCWMGMIQGRFIVKADVDTTNTTAVTQAIAAAPPAQTTSSGGCGCGGGSTGATSCHATV